MENNLPKGWVECSLGEILLSKKGKKPSETINEPMEGYVPYILIDELEGKTIRAYTNDPKVSIIDENYILLVWDGSIGKCGSGLKGAIGSTLVSLRPLDKIPTRFVEYTIKHNNNFIKETSTGTGLQHINKDFFEICKIPLPPLAEQHCIVSKLDALMENIESNKQRLDKIPGLLKRFRQSVLAAAVSGRLTEDWRVENEIREEWNEIGLEKALMSLDQGWSPKCENFPATSENHWGVIKTTSVQHMYFVEEENKQLPSHLVPDVKFELKVNDVLITRAGPKVRVGVCCHIKKTRTKLMICDKVYRLKLNQKITLPGFIEILLNTQEKIEEIDNMKTGISDSGVNLTQTKVKGILFLNPSIEEQQEIVRQVEQLFSFADKIETRYTKAKAMLDKLPQSILAKAFRGELVPQDPNDEPASVLLVRIKAEKEKLSVKNGKKRKTK